MAFNSFTANTIIRSSAMNANFAGIADGSELPTKREYIYFYSSRTSPTSGQTNYGDNDSEDKNTRFVFDKSKYTNIQAIYLQAFVYADAAGGTSYCELYNYTDTTSIAGSEISSTSTDNYNVETSSDIKANIANAEKVYKLRTKAAVQDGSTYNAHLIIDWK